MHSSPGGWGFSDVNTTIPDIDDTTAALRALARSRERKCRHCLEASG